MAQTTTAPQSPATALGEIVVTAQREKSTVQSVPISMTAVSGEQLQARGITSVADMSHEVPGLSMRSAGPGQTEFEARGLASSGGSSPTVGFYLDDIPLSPPATAQNGKVVIDPDLYDLSRIEVLRGPQGTLYGSGSMGGTIKLVTNQPQIGEFQASVEGIASATQGGGPNGGLKGMVNIPINDMVALRIVGTEKYVDGWIDRIVVNPFPTDTDTRGDVAAAPIKSVAKDVNTEQLSSFRASLLAKPNDDLSIVGSVFYQAMKQGGYNEYDLPPGSHPREAHYEAFDIKEPISDSITIYGLTIDQNLGFANLTSATSYWDRKQQQTQDASESVQYVFGLASPIALPFSETDSSQQFSQEVRLASPDGDGARFHWIVGAFYTKLNSNWNEYGANPAFASFSAPGTNPLGIVGSINNPYKITQYAAFFDAYYKITDTLKFTAGLRYFNYESSVVVDEYGLATANIAHVPTTAADKTTAKASGVTPRFDLSYTPDHNLTVYASASQGFRPGGANMAVPSFCGPAPNSYRPDSVWDYELGEKAKVLDGNLTVNSDVFYIKWKDTQQVLLLNCGFQYNFNAGNARSFGAELEVNYRLSDELTVSLNGTYTDAEIDEPAANTGIAPGSPILNVPKYTGNMNILYRRPINDQLDFVARLSNVYVGTSTDASFGPVNLPAYDLTNIRFGVAHPKWSAYLFIDNVTNKRAALTANNTSFQFNIPALVRMSTNQPRTFGIDISRSF
jgi:outer membrane receptor protein involved in Fe transport